MATPRSKPAQDPTLESPFELLLVLESLYEQLSLEGKWHFQALLLTVALPERVLVGSDFARLWLAPAAEELKLRGLDKRTLLTRYAGARPQLLLGEPVWRYASIASGPLAERFVPVSRRSELERVRKAVALALRDLHRFRLRAAKAVASLGDAPAWKRCAVCSPLRELSFFPPRGDEEQAAELQVRSHYLEVLGEPVFNDFGSSREWCIKRCPLCATHYLWKSDYEYLANGGTETDISLTRLTAEETARWLELVAVGLQSGRRPAPLGP